MGDEKHRVISLEMELRAAREKIQELWNALSVICKERDDARKQCQYLQERLLQSVNEIYNSGLANVAIDSPVARSLKGESIITECDSSSGTRNHHYQSSPADPLQAMSLMQEPSLVDLSRGDLVQYPCIDASEEYIQSSFPLQNMPPESISLDHNNSDGGRMFHLQEENMQMNNFSSNSLEIAQFYMMESMHDMDSCLPLGSSMISVEESVQSQGFGKAGLDYSNQGEGVSCQGNVNLQPQVSEEILINEPQQQKRIKYDNENQKGNSHLENSKNDDAKINVTDHGKSKDENENASPNPLSSGTRRLKSSKTSSRGAGNAKKRDGEGSSKAVPYHLEEPLEADPKVLLKRLPRKGELLEAVKNAGPLLQTLLIQTPHLNSYGAPFDMSMPMPSTHVSLRNPVGPNRIIWSFT